MNESQLEFKNFEEVKEEIFKNEYEMCKEKYNHLKIKKFYKTDYGYVAADDIYKARESVLMAYEKEKIISTRYEEIAEEIEYLNSDEAISEIIEDFDIFTFPSFLFK